MSEHEVLQTLSMEGNQVTVNSKPIAKNRTPLPLKSIKSPTGKRPMVCRIRQKKHQKDLNDIWGFAACPAPTPDPVPVPPIALLIECSKTSLVLVSNFPAASLKALGEMVAKERSWVVVWVVIETTIVDAVGGGVGLLDKRREMVGNRTPNSLDPTKDAIRTLK